MPGPEHGKDRLQTTSPALRDVVLTAAYSYKRSLSAEVRMIELGTFADEATKIRKLLDTGSSIVGSVALVDHATDRILLSSPKVAMDGQIVMPLKIKIDLMKMSSSRRRRQDRSVGLVIVGVQHEQSAIPQVASLLIKEKDPLSPAGVMVVTPDGCHIFFRDHKTAEQTREENSDLVTQVQGASLKNFASWNQLRHFYCPSDNSVATPVLM